jgi:hypothetical protein
MAKSAPETVIAIYRVRADKEKEFLAILRKHYPTLKALGLVTNDPPVIYRGAERPTDPPTIFEIFTWKDGEAPNTAHHLPEVMAIWEPMGQLCEDRNGRPKFEFPHVERLDLAPAGV